MHRFHCLPPQLHTLVQIRLASSSTTNFTRFPFPVHPNPSPYQIFHLDHNASQKDIKSRYYDLVRIYHPDSPTCRFDTPSHRHKRFQAITAAYDTLQKRSSGLHKFDIYAEEIERRRRRYERQYHRQRAHSNAGRYDWNKNPDDRWKDQMIIAFGLVSLGLGVAPGLFLFPFTIQQRHRDAVTNLAEARRGAREEGEERRRGLKERVLKSKGDCDRNDV